jgi:hypothetical protein
LLRVPATINSKWIIQRWNKKRPNFNLIAGDFYVYLVEEKIREEKKQREIALSLSPYNCKKIVSNPIRWIERLLQIPIDDYRKNATMK